MATITSIARDNMTCHPSSLTGSPLPFGYVSRLYARDRKYLKQCGAGVVCHHGFC